MQYSVAYSVYSQPSNPKVEAIFYVIADNCTGYYTPSMERPLTVIIIITTKIHLQYKK